MKKHKGLRTPTRTRVSVTPPRTTREKAAGPRTWPPVTRPRASKRP